MDGARREDWMVVGMGSYVRGVILGVAGALVLSAAGTVGAAPCQSARSQTCQAGTTLVRTDTKECKANKFRTSRVIKRICCQNAKGKTRCRPYVKCPRKSCS